MILIPSAFEAANAVMTIVVTRSILAAAEVKAGFIIASSHSPLVAPVGAKKLQPFEAT